VCVNNVLLDIEKAVMNAEPVRHQLSYERAPKNLILISWSPRRDSNLWPHPPNLSRDFDFAVRESSNGLVTL